jgi:methane monooxygenase component D
MFETLKAEDYWQVPEKHNPNSDLTVLYDLQPYTAYTEDLEFMWRWTIYRDHKLVQEGCSLTLDASKHAVQHVMAFFNMKNPAKKINQEL